MTRRGRAGLRVAVVLAAVVSFAGTGGEPAGAAVTQWNQVRNGYSDKCMVTQGYKPGARAFQFNCVPKYTDQQWAFDLSSQYHDYDTGQLVIQWRIRNRHSNLCLEAWADGHVSQEPCDTPGIPFQDWVFVYSNDQTGGWTHTRAVLDNKVSTQISNGLYGGCLAQQHSNQNSAPIFTTGCNWGYTDQLWRLKLIEQAER